jgi:hypothetical protein
MALDFLKDATNIVLVGPNGIGKSTLARNIAHQAVVNGHTVMFTSAGQMLGETLPPSTATRPCGGVCATMRRRACWSSTRSATSPIPTATPICSSSSSAAATNKRAP